MTKREAVIAGLAMWVILGGVREAQSCGRDVGCSQDRRCRLPAG